MKNQTFTLWSVMLVALASLAFPAWAADEKEGDILPTLTAHKVIVKADGKEVLEAAERAQPGEVIEYKVVYQNKSDHEVAGLQATLPVPAGMEYLSDTAKPVPVTASLDGDKYAAVPLKRKVKLPDGKEEERTVPYAEYRFLRWDIGALSKGKNSTVIARMRVTPNVAAEATQVKEDKK